MELEIDLAIEGPTGPRRRLGTARFKDIDPAVFFPFPGEEAGFAEAERWIGTFVWNGWPAAGRLVITGKLRAGGIDAEITPGEIDDPDERADVLKTRAEMAQAAGDDGREDAS